MINNLLRNIIEVRDIAAFINNVIVEMETKEEHDVKEILRRIAENNSFVKPEKCVWKVREVGFLRIIIRPDKIRIEKEKV